jgi:DNA polymerase elongation subunit (family B)
MSAIDLTVPAGDVLKLPAPRMLIYDIETSPSTCYSFSMWQTNIDAGKIIKPTEMMCFAARWIGEDETIFRSTYHDGQAAMREKAHRLFNEADILIGYNSTKFDTPHMHREFLLAGLPPPSPSKEIDIFKAVKRRFRFTHNGLDFICSQLGLDRKQPHQGFSLWTKCLGSDPEAWQTMKTYCMNDVVITEKLYHRLLPWIPAHPSMGAMSGEDVCPSCGSADLIKQGFTYTSTGAFQRWSCRACSKWSRSTRRVAGTGITSIAA